MLSRLCLALSTAGFVTGAVAHLASFAPARGWLDERSFVALSLVLLAGLALPFAAMLVRLGRVLPRRPWRGRIGFYDLRPAAGLLPPALRALCLGVFLYTGVNFIACIFLIGGVKAAEQREGRFYLHDTAGQAREVPREAYLGYWAASARLVTGHMLSFYLLPLVYFRFVDPRRGELAQE
jgi:hypothetical protein